jgi:hypothetical protein
MTSRRAAGPGPRTAALRSSPRASRAAALALVLAAFVATVVVACGSASSSRPSGSPAVAGSPGGPAATGGGTASSGAPEVSFEPLPSGIVLPSVDPDATPGWPGATVLAVIHLTTADAQIQQAGQDLDTATSNQDLKAMWGAADGLAQLIDKLMPEVDRLGLSPETQAAEQIYQKAFPELSAGAKQLRDSITAGNTDGIIAGSQLIAQGLNDYAPVRGSLTDLFQQALLQQRLQTR